MSCSPDECEFDIDCNNVSQICNLGLCQAPSTQNCTENDDCDDEAICEQGICAYPPKCQRITGTLQSLVLCEEATFSAPTFAEPITATTTNCTTAFRKEKSVNTSGIEVKTEIASSLDDPNVAQGDECSGTFSAQDTSFVAQDCKILLQGPDDAVPQAAFCDVYFAPAPLCLKAAPSCPNACNDLAANPLSTIGQCE